MVKASELKAWRAGLGVTQAEAARLVGKSLRMFSTYEKGSAAIPDDVAAIVLGKGDAPAAAAQDKPPKAKAAKVADDTPPELVEAMQRAPLYAKTSEEAHAMRDELLRRAGGQEKAHRSCMPLIPLQPDWVTVESKSVLTKRIMGVFRCNAAIPDPKALAPRYSPRAVVTRSGALYDYETAQLLRRGTAA